MANLSQLQHLFPRPIVTLIRSLEQKRLHQAYLFHGPHLGSSTELAHAFSASLLCNTPNGANHCGQCTSCIHLTQGRHPDFFQIAPNDKGLITIDMIRQTLQKLFLSATESERKIFMIVGADTMNASAQNAMLKALEEPPPNTHFILCIKQPRRLLITVRSRAQGIHVNDLSQDEIKAWCAANELDDDLQNFIAVLSGNHKDEAQSLKDHGIATVFPQLKTCLQTNDSNIFHTIADLAKSRETFLLTLNLLEILVRDEMARRFGAKPETLYAEPLLAPFNLSAAALESLCAQLQKLRAYKHIALNRPMALESVLLDISAAQSQ